MWETLLRWFTWRMLTNLALHKAWRFWNKNLKQKPLALSISINSFIISLVMTSLLICRKDSLMNNWGWWDGGGRSSLWLSFVHCYFHIDAINVSSTGIQMLQLQFWGHTYQCMFAHSRRTEKHNLGHWATWGTYQRSWSSGGGWFYCSNCGW